MSCPPKGLEPGSMIYLASPYSYSRGETEAANRYVPDYAVSPGEVLAEYLDSYGMTQAELAARLGFAKKTVNEIVKGKAPIMPDTALKLERVFSRPAHFWNNLKQQYQEDRARLAEQEHLREHLDEQGVRGVLSHRTLPPDSSLR